MPGPLVLAHRGARTVAPENTVEAFALALTLGADGVELDVHRTLDGALVVHHDAHAPGLGVLAGQSFAAIRAARPEIPTLDESLDACDGTLVNVEIKNLPGDADFDRAETTAELVVATLERRDRRDRVLVSSFHLPTVDRVRELDASVPTAFLTGMGLDPIQVLDVCVAHGHGAYHPFVVMLQGAAAAATAARAHDLGIDVNVWTVNDASEIRRLADAGVDGIVTDVPDVAKAVLDAR